MSAWRQVFRILTLVIVTVLILFLGRMFTEVLLAAIVAAILYYLSLPLTARLESLRVPRFVAILSVFIFFILIFAFLIVYMVPVITEQLIEFAEEVPAFFTLAEQWFQQIEARVGAEIGEEQLQEFIDRATETVTGFIETAVASVIGVLANVLTVILVSVAGIMAAFFLLQDHERIHQYLRRYIPEDVRPPVNNVLLGANMVLSGFLKGRIIIGIIVGTAAGVILAILGVPFAFILGVITAVLELIPYLGPILAAIPAILIALTVSPTTALIVVGVYFIIQQFESIILSPKIVGAHVKLHPVTVIFAVLIGKEVLGVLGVFVAIPIVGIAKVVAEEFLLTPEQQEEVEEETEEE